MKRRIVVGVLVVASVIALGRLIGPMADPKTPAKPKGAKAKPAKTTKTSSVGKSGASTGSKWTSAVEPKPLSENVKKGLAWLAKSQLENGGWSQGEESAQMGRSGSNVQDTANVADTCMATLALMRAGNTPGKGEYSKNVRAAIDYICGEIEQSDEKSLYITQTRGTRVQGKLGPYIDTFLASMLLAELKGQMTDSESEKRVADAFEKVMDKIEKNQQADGTWDKSGWAPVLSQSMASKALNRAAQAGRSGDEQVRQKAENYARGQFDKKSGGFKAEGSAGVALYAGAGNLGAMRDSDNTNKALEADARQRLASPSTPEPQRKEAQQTLKRIEEHRADLREAENAMITKLEDKQFISGFGSNGGEEFLSYMNIGESLVVKGGDEWKKWDTSMTENLNRIQNNEGTWSGHHCITGRTFCTSAALLTLTVDRAPIPVADKIKRQ